MPHSSDLRRFRHVRVDMLVPPFFVLPFPAWLVLGWWFVLQVLTALPEVSGAGSGSMR